MFAAACARAPHGRGETTKAQNGKVNAVGGKNEREMRITPRAIISIGRMRGFRGARESVPRACVHVTSRIISTTRLTTLPWHCLIHREDAFAILLITRYYILSRAS